MLSTKRFMMAAMLVVSMFSFMAFAGSPSARAQFTWPPQCSPIIVANSSSCTVTLCLKTNGPALCITVLPGTKGLLTVPFGVLFGGVGSAANISYPFVLNGNGTYTAANITMPPQLCCCSVDYDPATCSMVITNSFVLPCNP